MGYSQFSGNSSSDLDAAIDRIVEGGFDLSKDYMLRVHLLQIESQHHVLVVVIHHIATDGWSTPLLVREFNTIYASYRSNTSIIPYGNAISSRMLICCHDLITGRIIYRVFRS
jgi:hypothetical protein